MFIIRRAASNLWEGILSRLIKNRQPKKDIKYRNLPSDQAKSLKPGDHHYTAYVGPPSQYDFMGASQFRLLCALGLRGHHDLLDFGCGSLRAGRLFIPYLNRGKYSGIEPNAWLLKDAISKEIGKDMVSIKSPIFSHDDTFTCKDFADEMFDYILAQSVFSHTGGDLANRLLASFNRVLKAEGLLACTFMHLSDSPENQQNGWVYPKCVRYQQDTIFEFMQRAGFFSQEIPWYHPRQSWYIASKSPSKIIPAEMLRRLRGPVFFDPVFSESLK